MSADTIIVSTTIILVLLCRPIKEPRSENRSPRQYSPHLLKEEEKLIAQL